jgi:hypothetical protein
MTSEQSLRSLIREKLQSGSLPGDDCTKVFVVSPTAKSATHVVRLLRRTSY